jgi:glycerol-3-phosphate acyltransferase PlsY
MGASRVAREVGKGAGVLVFLLDLTKGALPVLWARGRGCRAGRRGLLGFAPLLANITVNHGRGAATVAGTALVEDPEALGLVGPVLTGGFLLHRHPQSVLLGYLLLAPVRLMLGRPRAAVGWTAASMAVVILARAHGVGGDTFSAQALKERLWYDREPRSRVAGRRR